MTIQNELKDFPVKTEVAVAWGEMDYFHHVNNIIYFRYFETGRIKYFEKIGIYPPQEGQTIGPILAKTHCTFIFPVTFPDTLTIGVRSKTWDRHGLVHEYKIVSQKHQKVAAIGEGHIASFDYGNHQKSPFPEGIIQAIENLEKGSL
jgi:acyl-CoA thioester hydrolase